MDSDVLPQGRVGFALVLNQKAIDANEPMALVISQWGQSIGKIKEIVEEQAKKAIEEGLHQKSEDYRGIGIKTIFSEDSSRLGFGFSSALSYCFADDCVIASEDIELVKYVIAHIQGAGSPSLGDDADYNAAVKAVGPYHDIDFYVNIKQIIKTILARDSSGKARAAIGNLCFDNVVSLSSSIGVNRDAGGSASGKVFLKINGSKKGVCKMLEAESAALRAPRFVPASTYSMTFFNFDIKKAYIELANILNSFNPMYASMLYMPILPPGPEGEPGLQLKGDIIDHLGPQVVISQSINKPFSKDTMPTELLVALAVNNRSALEKTMSVLYSKLIAPNNPDCRRELLGHTIYQVSLPGFPFLSPGKMPMQGPAAQGAPEMPKMAFTITNTHLIFGAEAVVEKAIRTLSSTDGQSVSSAKWFSFAKSAIPSVVGVAGLQDNEASGELFWWMMKNMDEALWGSAGPASIKIGSSGIGELVNFSLLPEFDIVRKYFGVSALYGLSRPDGFFFEFKYLNKSGSD